MRRVVIGIGTTDPNRPPCIVCGSAAYAGDDPYPKNLNSYMKNILCWTATIHPDPTKAIEATTWRLIEKLYLSKIIPEPELEHIRILIKPRYRQVTLTPPSLVVRSHWLISASNMLLNEL